MEKMKPNAMKFKGRLSTNRNIHDFSNFEPPVRSVNAIALPPSGTLVDGQHRRQTLQVLVMSDAPN